METNSCRAQVKRRGPKCGKPPATIRTIQVAPGLWLQTPLCYDHQCAWDQAGEWTDSATGIGRVVKILREDPAKYQ